MGRGDNSLLLWSNSKQNDPVCSFVGHTDVILDFAFRPNRESQMEIVRIHLTHEAYLNFIGLIAGISNMVT